MDRDAVSTVCLICGAVCFIVSLAAYLAVGALWPQCAGMLASIATGAAGGILGRM